MGIDRFRNRSFFGTIFKVLHGCRQLVPWGVRLSPATAQPPVTSCHHSVGDSSETAYASREEGGDDVKSSRPCRLGDTRITMAGIRGQLHAMWCESRKPVSVRIESATRLYEAGIASNRASAMARWIRSLALYTPPSSHGSWGTWSRWP